MNNLLKIILLAIFFFVGSSAVMADDATNIAPIAQVIWVKGSVTATQTNNQPRDLKRRSPLYLRDTIVTGPDGEAQIVFTDQSTVALRSGSELMIADYKFDPKKPNQSNEKYVLNLVKGGLRTITGIIPKDNPDSYQVNTPVATIGVRGTEYSIACSGIGGKVSNCATATWRGVINVSNSSGTIQLQACNGTASAQCAPYAVINSGMKPLVQTQRPVILQTREPMLIPSLFGAPPVPRSGSGGSIIVKGKFCI